VGSSFSFEIAVGRVAQRLAEPLSEARAA